MRFRRRPKFKLEPFDFDAVPLPEPISVEEAADEGLMLAEYASRMALKNRILIEGITGDEPYAAERFHGYARDALERIAVESTSAAERLAERRSEASVAEGRSGHIHDYRAADADNLEHREQLSRAVASGLRARADDPAYLATFIERAREDAWREVAASIEDTLVRDHVEVTLDDAYEQEREERMRSVMFEDLAQLERDLHPDLRPEATADVDEPADASASASPAAKPAKRRWFSRSARRNAG